MHKDKKSIKEQKDMDDHHKEAHTNYSSLYDYGDTK